MPRGFKTLLIIYALLILFVGAVIYWFVEPAHAQPGFQIQIKLQCNTTKVVVAMLLEKYREVPTGGGASIGEHVRLFESHDAGDKQTWTLVISNANGLSCIIKGGQDWITNPAIIKGDPS